MSGLSQWLGEQLSVLKAIPPFATMLIVCLMAAAVTEVASNAATASIMLPILADLVIALFISFILEILIKVQITRHLFLHLPLLGGADPSEPAAAHAAGHGHVLVRLHAARIDAAQRHRLLGVAHETGAHDARRHRHERRLHRRHLPHDADARRLHVRPLHIPAVGVAQHHHSNAHHHQPPLTDRPLKKQYLLF